MGPGTQACAFQGTLAPGLSEPTHLCYSQLTCFRQMWGRRKWGALSFSSRQHQVCVGWGRGTNVSGDLCSLETPPYHSQGSGRSGRRMLRLNLQSRGTFWIHESSLTQASPYTHFSAGTLGQAQLKSSMGSQCGKLGTGVWLGSALSPRAPDLQSRWPRDLQPGVSSQA